MGGVLPLDVGKKCRGAFRSGRRSEHFKNGGPYGDGQWGLHFHYHTHAPPEDGTAPTLFTHSPIALKPSEVTIG